MRKLANVATGAMEERPAHDRRRTRNDASLAPSDALIVGRLWPRQWPGAGLQGWPAVMGRPLGLRSAFLFGCISLAMPGLAGAGFYAFQAWTRWEAAWTSARGAVAVGDVMRTTAVLVAERGWQRGEAIAGGAPSEGLVRAFDETDRVLAAAQTTVEQAGLPAAAVQRARNSLPSIRSRAALALQAPAGLRVLAERYDGMIEELEESISVAERGITLGSPAVGVVLGLARVANEAHGSANYRGMELSSWFGGHDLTAAQKEAVMALNARIAQLLTKLQRDIRVSGLSSPLVDQLGDINTRFLTENEPTYRKYTRAAIGGGDRPISHPQYRAWHRAAIETLRPLRELLLGEAIVRAEQTMRDCRRDMIVAAGMALLSLGLVIAALLALLRQLIEPVRAMTAAMTALAAGDLTGAMPIRSRLREIGAIAAAVAVFRENLASLQQRTTELNRTNLHFTAALDSMSQGLVMYDADERLVVYNQRYCEIVHFTADRIALGMTYRDILALAIDIGHFQGRTVDQVYAEQRGRVGSHDAFTNFKTGATRQAIATRFVNLSGGGWVATLEDVTERREADARIAYLANHDALTGLSNRMLFNDRLNEALSRVRRGEHVAVHYLNLDRFKNVNDTLGHPVGDELLKAVSQRLLTSTRETDLVARLGGDEFAVIQASGEGPLDASVLADRLVDTLREPFEFQGQMAEISTSIGVVLADTLSTPDELLRNAHIALGRAKTEGQGTWCFFENGMNEELQRRRALETDLRAAIALGQLEVHYQPLVKARTQMLTGFEALMRWRHPVRGLVPPSEFIAVAEEIGLIQAMGGWILTKACTEAATWPEHIKIAVNLSPLQFKGGQLVKDVRQALGQSGLAAARLELEITESVLLQDSDATADMLHQLHSLGVRISMDDFGTGYSSLSYLQRFPFDKIKIDQSFVRSMNLEKGSLEIIRAVVGLGKALDMEVLAEGVETVEQLALLQTEGCDELQGYLFSKPQPVQDVAAFILRHALDTPSEDPVRETRLGLTHAV